MPKGSLTATDVLNKVFLATDPAWNANSYVYLALHTADPTASGNQTSSEATYTSYDRVQVARTSGGWDVSGTTARNHALLQFPQCTGGSNTITHVSVGTAASGSGQILYVGALSSPLSVTNLIQPQFAATGLTVTEA